MRATSAVITLSLTSLLAIGLSLPTTAPTTEAPRSISSERSHTRPTERDAAVTPVRAAVPHHTPSHVTSGTVQKHTKPPRMHFPDETQNVVRSRSSHHRRRRPFARRRQPFVECVRGPDRVLRCKHIPNPAHRAAATRSRRFFFPDEEVIAAPTIAAPTVEPTPGEDSDLVTRRPLSDHTEHATENTETTTEQAGTTPHGDGDAEDVVGAETGSGRTHDDVIRFSDVQTSRPATDAFTLSPAQTTPSSSSVIHFGGRPSPQGVQPMPECGGEPYFAYNNRTGDCQELWTTDDCPPGFWFVLSRRTHEGRCLRRPCPVEQILFNGECHPTDTSERLCPDGMAMFVSEYGDGFCDCSARQAYWPAHRRCYPVYTRGPCERGHHLVVPEGLSTALCLPTPCPDGTAFWSDENDDGVHDATPTGVPTISRSINFGGAAPTTVNTGNCYPLEDEDNTPCPPGRLEVDVYSLQLTCHRVLLQAVFNPPKVRCAPGSQLDFNGKCRKELFQKFRTRLLVRGGHQPGEEAPPTSDSLCPAGFVSTPDGRCVHPSAKTTGLG